MVGHQNILLLKYKIHIEKCVVYSWLLFTSAHETVPRSSASSSQSLRVSFQPTPPPHSNCSLAAWVIFPILVFCVYGVIIQYALVCVWVSSFCLLSSLLLCICTHTYKHICIHTYSMCMCFLIDLWSSFVWIYPNYCTHSSSVGIWAVSGFGITHCTALSISAYVFGESEHVFVLVITQE